MLPEFKRRCLAFLREQPIEAEPATERQELLFIIFIIAIFGTLVKSKFPARPLPFTSFLRWPPHDNPFS
ncbi:uncharacterized protein PITG_18308 [Phytophthora infestans T30-4]|uniref:Uncharacterized protein n=1 Tax=Phytophthora infestans (strain T30-4) TaxID=403677 RepID=D0NXV0_PHYIT|nr:uncharacterized protein PITG_18308 [Phytophthora infestans T30-4]EEY67901.1 hypothetical protein PITG_18308 [Phytophthora infestans T30-4]|eukprot:XP_002997763.1 hypothetical protein PITG_18308 [Phytophthora infestans T30-4]